MINPLDLDEKGNRVINLKRSHARDIPAPQNHRAVIGTTLYGWRNNIEQIALEDWKSCCSG
ncbi:hypothetical protein N7453_000084 [Penicillium expansum]|nr:hypothetical protein N7453_000084 [Penicillium expansum]